MEKEKKLSIPDKILEEGTPPKVIDALALLYFKNAELVWCNYRKDRYDEWNDSEIYVFLGEGIPHFFIEEGDLSFLLDNKIVERDSASGGEYETMWSETYKLTDYYRIGLGNRISEAQQKNKTAQS